MSEREQRIPVIFGLNEDGEATGTVHLFCCTGCRSRSVHKDPDEVSTAYGENPRAYFPPDAKCELCGRTIPVAD